jgi:hypothetical protein
VDGDLASIPPGSSIGGVANIGDGLTSQVRNETERQQVIISVG